jgi:cytochrome c556
MTSAARTVTVCLAALALVVSGCGSNDTQAANDYISKINKVQADFANSLSSGASTGTTSASDPLAGAKATFREIDDGLTKVVANLKAITPPDKVRELHQQLVTEISQLDREVKKIEASVSTGDLKKIAAAQTNFASAAARLQNQFGQTIDSINQKLHG